MKKYFPFLLLLLSVIPVVPVLAEDVTNSGFIPGQIWYSKETLTEGETVNIHTAVWNGEKDYSLSAKIEFYDKNVILGTRDVTISPLELEDVSVPWKITSGDHVISAKIISSKTVVSGKEEILSLRYSKTSNDKQSVPVVVKNEKGEVVTTTDSLNNFIDKAGTEIKEVVPANVSSSVSNGFTAVDDFREKTSVKVEGIKDDAKEELSQIKGQESEKVSTEKEVKNTDDVIKKPITYIKLFLFTALSFIFANKIVFYGILVLAIFWILRLIYRAIKNR